MTEHLPDRLDLLAAAEAGRELHGRIALASLERVAPLLASTAGELQVVMYLGRDPEGTFRLSGSIRGNLVLQCQRCLEELTRTLDIEFRLGLVRSQEAAERLLHGYEPLLVTAEPARIADIVSDEVLLALPFAPVHEDANECHGIYKEYQPSTNAQRENPFAVLAGLKQKQ
jgi:DUF177 domain-containing protein